MSIVGIPGVILAGGARSHQENYAAAFAAAGCQLLAVAIAEGIGEAEVSRHAELAESLDLPLLPLDRAVALPGATIASICVSLPHRARAAAISAEAGLDLYLDKPLAGSAEDAAAIAATVRATGVRAQVFSHVTAPWARAARAAIAEGRVGRIVALHADMLMAKGISAVLPSNIRQERAGFADLEGDIVKRELTDMGVYPISLASWLLGGRALSVQAATANHFFAEHLSRDVEDYAAMLVNFDGGVTASITCGRVGWHAWRRPILARVVIVGQLDTLVFDSEPAELIVSNARNVMPPARNALDPMEMWLSTRQGPRPQPATSSVPLDGGNPDVAAFVDSLNSGIQAGIGVDEAAHHCAVIAAAYRSAASVGDGIAVPQLT
jgi:predicted dehydrogenase